MQQFLMTIRKNYFLPGAALPLLNDSNNMYIIWQLCRTALAALDCGSSGSSELPKKL